MTTDPDIIDQTERFAEAVAKVTPCTCSAQRERAEMAEAERDKARAEQDRLADIIKGLYETIDDERATIRKLVRERMQAQAERNMAVGKVDEMRQQLGIEVRSRDEWEANAERAMSERDAAIAKLESIMADVRSYRRARNDAVRHHYNRQDLGGRQACDYVLQQFEGYEIDRGGEDS